MAWTFLWAWGGGSALDSTKATALLATHEGPISRYFGLHKVPSPCLPTILIPTTAGTGSEMTSNAVLNDPEPHRKKGTVSAYLYARLVLLDPELTLGLPPFYTVITGLDALVHGIESFVNINATDFTDALNIRAMRMLVENIREAYANGGNLKAREQMLYGAPGDFAREIGFDEGDKVSDWHSALEKRGIKVTGPMLPDEAKVPFTLRRIPLYSAVTLNPPVTGASLVPR